jgi:hypothetical protein
MDTKKLVVSSLLIISLVLAGCSKTQVIEDVNIPRPNSPILKALLKPSDLEKICNWNFSRVNQKETTLLSEDIQDEALSSMMGDCKVNNQKITVLLYHEILMFKKTAPADLALLSPFAEESRETQVLHLDYFPEDVLVECNLNDLPDGNECAVTWAKGNLVSTLGIVFDNYIQKEIVLQILRDGFWIIENRLTSHS